MTDDTICRNFEIVSLKVSKNIRLIKYISLNEKYFLRFPHLNYKYQVHWFELSLKLPKMNISEMFILFF